MKACDFGVNLGDDPIDIQATAPGVDLGDDAFDIHSANRIVHLPFGCNTKVVYHSARNSGSSLIPAGRPQMGRRSVSDGTKRARKKGAQPVDLEARRREFETDKAERVKEILLELQRPVTGMELQHLAKIGAEHALRVAEGHKRGSR